MNLSEISETIKQGFKENVQIQSFEEYLKMFEASPRIQSRGTAEYAADMMDHYGKSNGGFNIFKNKVIGLEKVQNQIYQILRAFSHLGINNRLVLLHGPNGSAKSTLISSVMEGMSDYSREKEGALYSFSWIFPIDKITRGSLGIRGDQEKKSSQISSFAYLSDDEIACIIPSELRDHPLLLIPGEQRNAFLKNHDSNVPERLKNGGLSHRDQLIYQALLTSYQGDYAQILKHIRVERFYLSKIYRTGLITVEPQMHVDAQYQQLTMNRSLSQLPASLQGLNLFTVSGDLADANRGMIDYNDLLKRPIDSFKYLLTATETSKVNVGHSILNLDTLFIGSSNELQLDAFKEYPDFSSFKGRIELVKVPYLLRVSQEREIYEPILSAISGDKPVTPHTSWTLAMWAVLTRLKKPHHDRFGSELSNVIEKLTPLAKLKLYENGEMPEKLSNEERKHLKNNLSKIEEEYSSVLYYEGRTGASARELKSVLIDAAQNPDYKTLSPLSVLGELKKFVKRITEYEFLRQDSVDGYHDHEKFIETVIDEYAGVVDREVRECLGLYDTRQWGDFMKRYITHLSSLLKKEKIKNTITGAYEDPDQALLTEFESIVGAPTDAEQRNQFRQNLITQIGAWVLDHPKEPIEYFKVFPELRAKMEKHFYESQKNLLQKMNLALKQFGSDYVDPNSEGAKLASLTLENMQKKFGYSVDGAKEVISFLMTKKY
jgi:predicted Ser/Thr protein kinase